MDNGKDKVEFEQVELEEEPAEILSGNPGNEDNHYQGLVQPVEIIYDLLGPSFCIANVIKYMNRHTRKGGIGDLEKALWYLRYITEPKKQVTLAEYYKAQDTPRVEQKVISAMVDGLFLEEDDEKMLGKLATAAAYLSNWVDQLKENQNSRESDR